jgi:hypothetical protein
MDERYEKLNGRWLVWVMGQYDSRGGTFAHLIGGERWPSADEVRRWYVEDGPLSAMIADGISEEEAWQGLEELGVVEIRGADGESERKLEEIIRELAKMEKGYDGIELEWAYGGPGIVGVK